MRGKGEKMKMGAQAEASDQAEAAEVAARTYCLVPRDLADKLHEPLRRHFRDHPDVEVVIERRDGERRRAGDRRAKTRKRRLERRKVRARAGRRVGERRASLAPVAQPDLPRKARSHAERLLFVERVEPSGERAEDLDTARLVASIQAGDREAFADLYVRYFDRVYAYLRVILNDRHEAEDSAQEIFTDLLEGISGYERRAQPFRAWLFVVARNHAISKLRQLGRLELLETEELNRHRERQDADEDDDLRALDWITDVDLLVFIQKLPLPQRQVLTLRYLLDLPHAEVARILGRSHADVRALHSRAVRVLGKRLKAIGRGPKEGPKEGEKMRAERRVREARVLRSRRFALLGN